ncbi:nucleotide-diphospho-sugar transferase [bacterium]|nr:nucleotide-diphospho-sugar transferase [bacterium]MBU1435294.1 nucleotide-diphospho-sugar transferase [bacterium]MBU1503492.1 nucleotide-diphospho-sugar transferase [bacterium]
MNQIKFLPPHPLNTAVLFLVFNRLDTTKQVFESIRQAKPPRLYIAADGARETKDGEVQRVNAVRDYVISNIDWECEVKTLFREQNLGCKYAVSGAIDWFFENEEMGIILEDDCLPSQSFFWFCEELLKRYKDEDNVFLISGDGRGTKQINIDYDYDFVKYSLIWGWASWSRVWKKYDVKMSDWNDNKLKIINNISQFSSTRRYWESAFENTYDNKIDTWDYQFSYTLQKNQGLCIVPKVNMISNIGFGVDATHTSDSDNINANLPNLDLEFPIVHPSEVVSNKLLNKFYDLNEFKIPHLVTRIINKLSRLIINRNIIK